ncbi:DUF2971 domain-containing protein [Segetibacter koreensis]|uniref:DUF2971 domain-containing protein n=1 Tax=Segetibacter koreensis TaxID=398037 RepID=UPI00037B1AC9|nr:DUF2971 domain-containing protein [Segetibacter koreensis]
METNRIKRLYKFASLDSAKRIIIGGKLKFTKPFDFNDPFDCNIERLTFDVSKTDEEFKIYEKRIREKARAEHGDRIKELNWAELYKRVQIGKIKRSKICSFSTINDHPLLWSHYGDKHLGACLIFDNTVAIGERFKDEKKFKLGIEGLVEYKKFKKVNFCESRINALAHLFCVKGRDWEYEKEYRMITFDLDNEYIDFEPNFLKGIIFGMKVTNREIEAFKKDVASVSNAMEFKVAVKKDESLKIINWDCPGELFSKETRVIGLSTDPLIKGLFERLGSE